VLALGFFATSAAGSGGASAATALFGAILSLTLGQALTAAIIGAVLSAVMLAVARPLLFATIDPAVASARGVPVILLGLIFLLALGGVAAEATQAVGAMLLLGLVAAPAGAAHQLTSRPYAGMALAAAIAVASVWLGLWIASVVTAVPPSSAIVAVAATAFLMARPVRRLRLLRPAAASWRQRAG
jgi:zinc/manganese transport system permease protein